MPMRLSRARVPSSKTRMRARVLGSSPTIDFDSMATTGSELRKFSGTSGTPGEQRARETRSGALKTAARARREGSEPGREEAAAPKAQGRGNPAVLPERGARGASRAKSEASPKKMKHARW